jgi:hypothetical protein
MGKMNGYIKEVDCVMELEDGWFAGCVLPVVRRMYSEDGGCPEIAPAVSVEWVIENFGEYSKRNVQLYKELNSTIALDGEAEFCSIYILKLIPRLKAGNYEQF